MVSWHFWKIKRSRCRKIKTSPEIIMLRKMSRHKRWSVTARAILDRRTARSPIDGILLRRLIGLEEYVNRQAQIAQIAPIDPLFVDVFCQQRCINPLPLVKSVRYDPQRPLKGSIRPM